MAKIPWSNELSVGVKKIDDEHKELIRIANTLLDAVDKGSNRKVVADVIKKLRDYTVFHFRSEEALMKEKRYPKLGEHASRHARLKLDVKEFQRMLYEKKSPAPALVMDFLRKWLLEHILDYDRDLARFIKDQCKEEACAEVCKK